MTANSELEAKACRFAQDVHLHQPYGDVTGPSAYFGFHLVRVLDVLGQHRIYDPTIRAAAWLHDAIEDHPDQASREKLAELFGDAVATLVWRVTNEPGANRRERFEKTVPKVVEDRRAVLIKLVDRIANFEHSIRTRSPHIPMYRKEHEAFRAAFYVEGEFPDLWDRLDRKINGGKRKP